MKRHLTIALVVMLGVLAFQPVAALDHRISSPEAREPNSPGDEKNPRANSDPIYSELRNIRFSGEYAGVENVAIKRDNATITLKSGQVFFLAPVSGKVTGAVFLGDGEFALTPLSNLEKKNLSILTARRR